MESKQSADAGFISQANVIHTEWHTDQAVLAMSRKDWFAETFHRAWIMKANPEIRLNYDLLHAAHEKLMKNQDKRNFIGGTNLLFGEQVLPAKLKEILKLPCGDQFGRPETAMAKGRVIEVFEYDDGYFLKHDHSGRLWTEAKNVGDEIQF